MSTFPTAIPSYLGFTATHTLSADSHAAQHNQEQADIAAIATKVGTGNSVAAGGTVLAASGSGTSSWSPVDLTAMVSGTLPLAHGGTGGTSVLLSIIYPVGCIYTETTGVNPATTLGFGSWSAFGAGRVLVGNGTSDQAFVAGATGGESNHTLSTAEMPNHNHTLTDPGHVHTSPGQLNVNSGSTATAYVGNSNTPQALNGNTTGITIASAGSGNTHNNLQPYVVVYFWLRTA